MSDAVRLTVPHAPAYYGVVRLVVGGLAARLDLSYEHVEDVQVALESLLATDAYAAREEVTVEVSLAEGGLEILVGPLDARRLEPDLEPEGDEAGAVGLRRVLSTLTGGFDVERRDGNEWVRMRKDVVARGNGR